MARGGAPSPLDPPMLLGLQMKVFKIENLHTKVRLNNTELGRNQVKKRQKKKILR